MLGLTILELYNSFFNRTQENNNVELYKVAVEKSGGVSYEKVRDEIEKDLGISDITPVDLEEDIIVPIIVDQYREQVTKRRADGGYINNLAGYQNSVFQDFRICLRTEVALVEDDIRLVLDKYNSSFIT